MEKKTAATNISSSCFHCGDSIRGERIEHEGKLFCCSGCKIVFEILQQYDLCKYYSIEQSPGNTPSPIELSRFDYLDDESVQKQLFDFSDGKTATITFSLPAIHCSSCIWLLEQLYKLDAGIVASQVDYLKKQLSVKFLQQQTSLKNIVVLLASIGYEPELRFDSVDKKMESKVTRSLYYKIGVAGFCFGNSMLFSFPEYLGVDASEQFLKFIFSQLNLLLGLPVFFYCSQDYFTSALKGLKRKIINIDVPIALGILLLFGRSFYEIISGTGPGFIDSLSGLLFFLLLGKIFQSKTYDRLNFERNYKSYFPLSVSTIRNGIETTVPISSLTRGNRIVIRHGEIIPADSILLKGNAAIDYSFVTGEATPVEKVLGEMVYAGGREAGGVIELEVMKEVSQSYLTQLWNNFSHSTREKGQLSELSNSVSKYFTIIVLFISFGVLLYWLPKDVTTAINAFTGILIVACPCALAISIPFTLGTTMRIFGKNGFYLKNTAVIETLSKIDTIVFDKTGTITHAQRSNVEYVGTELTNEELNGVFSVVSNSVHPISMMIAEQLKWGRESLSELDKSPINVISRNEVTRNLSLPLENKNEILSPHFAQRQNDNNLKINRTSIGNFSETVGKGISGNIGASNYRIGTKEFIGSTTLAKGPVNETRSYLSINGEEKGFYSIKNLYREGLSSMMTSLGKKIQFAVVSGDNESERIRLQSIFPKATDLQFNQSPADKMEYVKLLQVKGKKVMMIGDGLNDAGALMQSNLGIAVSENSTQFSPSSDAILSGASLRQIPDFLRFSSTSMKIVISSFILAFMYNTVGIYFALQGMLTPIMAAILMPASSITIVLFTTVTTQLLAKKRGLL